MDRWEERRGDVITGGYGLVDPNGQIRTVFYEVTGSQGFRAVVQTRPPSSTQLQFSNNHLYQRSERTYPVQHLPLIARVQ